jgi:hypothetical protein
MLTAVSLAATAGPDYGLDSVARRALDDGLAAQGVTEPELGFYKFWATDSFFRLKAVERLMSHPLEVLPYVESSAAVVGDLEQQPARLLRFLSGELDVRLSAKDSQALAREIGSELKRRPRVTEPMPAGLRDAINLVLAGYSVADRYFAQALAAIPERELNILLGEAPGFWRDEGDTVEHGFSGRLHREFGKDYDTALQVKSETLLAYARKVDRKALAKAGLVVTLAAAEASRALTTQPPSFAHEQAYQQFEGVQGGVFLTLETEWGLVIVGGPDDNAYTRDACLLIDVGGDDRYRNRAGGAVGVLDKPYGVTIDLAGDDLYDSERMFSQGAALFGAGVLIDVSGSDVYRSTHHAQGAAIFGTGVLWDWSGRDIYDAGFYAQGAGHYGVGALLDNEGDDSYRSFCYCQGFSGTWGYGLLAERQGDDLYYAGGKYKHEPLLPREYRSFSQGFSIGVRPDAAGGIAFLCDRQGNDFYDSEVFTQGTSYWYSLGMLWDGEGFDHYTAAQYTQGAGIHLSVGALVDEEGNDSYFSRLGPSQGEGHDLAVGVLVDRKGDDGYYASGGGGIGLTNSVGLFMDCDGNDWYASVESLICHGSSNWARGFGGMGVFMDLAGRDWYNQRNLATDNARWTKGTYGSGVDLDRPATVIDWEPEVDTSEASIDSVITAPVESVFKTASMWAVGNVRKKVLRGRKELIRLGEAAIQYVYDKKLDTKDGLESEAIIQLMKAWPDTAKPYLFRGLRDDRFLARQNSAYWLGEMGKGALDAVESILVALKAGRITPRRGAYALGSIGDSLVVPRILYLLGDTFEVSRIVTAEACGKLKNPVAIPDLIRTLSDRYFTVRSAAEAGLVAIGEPSLDPLLGSLATLKPVPLGHALRAVGLLVKRLDTLATEPLRQKCRASLLRYIGHGEPFVRLTAVEALRQMMNAEVRAALTAARPRETNEFVLTQYRQAIR